MKSLGLYLLTKDKPEEGADWLKKYLVGDEWVDIEKSQTANHNIVEIGAQERGN